MDSLSDAGGMHPDDQMGFDAMEPKHEFGVRGWTDEHGAPLPMQVLPTFPGCWTTSEGRVIPYGELEAKHLTNILRMLLRQAVKAKAQIELFVAGYPCGLCYRGDAPRPKRCLEFAFGKPVDFFLSPAYWDLLAEFKRRKLSFDLEDYRDSLRVGLIVSVNECSPDPEEMDYGDPEGAEYDVPGEGESE